MANIEKCPTCEATLEMEDSAYDQLFECPKCRTEIMIPRPVVIPRSVKMHRALTTPLAPQSGPSEIIVKGVDISLLNAMRLIGVFFTASFIFSLIGALIWLFVKSIMSLFP
ncbi:MAG: hypothetical protein ABSH14_05075 [Verrucomicrobiia bacterium]|jgi:predicted RNA-binding Zn-ribbon protein involved in translation (DUF1610 family)